MHVLEGIKGIDTTTAVLVSVFTRGRWVIFRIPWLIFFVFFFGGCFGDDGALGLSLVTVLAEPYPEEPADLANARRILSSNLGKMRPGLHDPQERLEIFVG